MTFLGFAINYMIRMNINIAIVSMIKNPKRNINSEIVSECTTNTVLYKSNSTITQKSSLDMDVSNCFIL